MPENGPARKMAGLFVPAPRQWVNKAGDANKMPSRCGKRGFWPNLCLPNSTAGNGARPESPPVMTTASAPQPQQLAPVSKAEMIDRILSTAKQAAIVSNRASDFQAQAADFFITLAFKSENELGSICKKTGAIR